MSPSEGVPQLSVHTRSCVYGPLRGSDSPDRLRNLTEGGNPTNPHPIPALLGKRPTLATALAFTTATATAATV